MERDNADFENISRPGLSFSVADVFALYGWYLLIIAVLLVYLYKKAQPTIDKYLDRKAEQEYAAKYHKDPDLAASRLAAQQIAVQRLQDKHNVDAVKYQQKLEDKETKKRDELLRKQNGTDGHRLGSASTSSLKPEYNPLMGDTTSRTFRPQRKSPCSGGGCGR